MKPSPNNSDERSDLKTAESTIAEKLRVASELRDLQEKLAPLRAANKADRAKRKVQIRIKTRT